MAGGRHRRKIAGGKGVAEAEAAWVGAEIAAGGDSLPVGTVMTGRINAVMSEAARAGLLGQKDGRIGARLSAELIARAKASTGLKTDTELLEFALAELALEDRFYEAFEAVRGTVDPDLKLGH